MTLITTDSQHYTDIASAIRTKLGVSTTYLPSEMAFAVSSIEGGGGGGGVPTGFTYYNGYLLPTLPVVSGYGYVWIRKNDQTNNYDLILGDSQWYADSSATLDNWALRNTLQDASYKYYTASQTTPTAWTEVTGTSYLSFGTNNNRDVIWTSHDILDALNGEVLLKAGNPVAHYV